MGDGPHDVQIYVRYALHVCVVLVQTCVLRETVASDSCMIRTRESPAHRTDTRIDKFLVNASSHCELVDVDIVDRLFELSVPLLGQHLCWVHRLVVLWRLEQLGQNGKAEIIL